MRPLLFYSLRWPTTHAPHIQSVHVCVAVYLIGAPDCLLNQWWPTQYLLPTVSHHELHMSMPCSLCSNHAGAYRLPSVKFAPDTGQTTDQQWHCRLSALWHKQRLVWLLPCSLLLVMQRQQRQLISCHKTPCYFSRSSVSSLVLQWVWQKLPQVKERRTKDLLIAVIASALYYNNTLTIALLQQQNQLPAFLTTWGKVSLLNGPCYACGNMSQPCVALLVYLLCCCWTASESGWCPSNKHVN